MTPRFRCCRGQSLVETALLLPLLLLLLAGGFWSFRHFALSGSAESASQAHLLRHGRRLPPMDSDLARTIPADPSAVRFQGSEMPVSTQLPLVRGTTGTTTGAAEVRCVREQVGAFLTLPSHAVRRETEAAVDCWGERTPSASTIRRTVGAVVLAGWLR